MAGDGFAASEMIGDLRPVAIHTSPSNFVCCKNSRSSLSRIGRPLHCGCRTVVTMPPHSRVSASSSFQIDSTCSLGNSGRGL